MPSGEPTSSKPVGGLAQEGGVERAAAEVVDGDELAGLDPLGRRVVHGGRLGLGDRRDVGDVGLPDGVLEQLLAGRPPSWPDG